MYLKHIIMKSKTMFNYILQIKDYKLYLHVCFNIYSYTCIHLYAYGGQRPIPSVSATTLYLLR